MAAKTQLAAASARIISCSHFQPEKYSFECKEWHFEKIVGKLEIYFVSLEASSDYQQGVSNQIETLENGLEVRDGKLKENIDLIKVTVLIMLF